MEVACEEALEASEGLHAIVLGDPDPRGGLHAAQVPSDLLQLSGVVHLPWWNACLQCGVEDHEVPAQLVGEPGDLVDVPFAVVARSRVSIAASSRNTPGMSS